MKCKLVFALALVFTGGLHVCLSIVAADSGNWPNARVYCLKKDGTNGIRGPVYVDRNGDGKIDWEVTGPIGGLEGSSSCSKMDTNFDGYYDVESCLMLTLRACAKINSELSGG